MKGSAIALLLVALTALSGCGQVSDEGRRQTCEDLNATLVDLTNGDWVCTDENGVVVYQPRDSRQQ